LRKVNSISFGTFICSFFLLFLTSCKKIKDVAQLSVPLTSNEVEFTLPQILTAGTLEIGELSLPINVDSIIKANNAEFALKNIKSVTANTCTLTMLDGDANNNFSAIKDCAIKFKSNINTNEIDLANVANNPDGVAYSLNVPVNSSIDLVDYFKTNSFTYKIIATTRKATSKPVRCKALFKFTLKVGL
jgi:hypothetical protein